MTDNLGNEACAYNMKFIRFIFESIEFLEKVSERPEFNPYNTVNEEFHDKICECMDISHKICNIYREKYQDILYFDDLKKQIEELLRKEKENDW